MELPRAFRLALSLGRISVVPVSPATATSIELTPCGSWDLCSGSVSASKPIFQLTPADGAIGSHAQAAQDAYADFKILAEKRLRKMSALEITPERP